MIGDGVITGIDSAKGGEFKPRGILIPNDNATVGDDFDRAVGMIFTLIKVIVNNRVSLNFMCD